jgi:hypothetical protein
VSDLIKNASSQRDRKVVKRVDVISSHECKQDLRRCTTVGSSTSKFMRRDEVLMLVGTGARAVEMKGLFRWRLPKAG